MSEVCTIGRANFNTTLYLSAIQKMSIGPGLRVSKLKGDGQLYPSKAVINQIAPTIEFDTLDVATALALNTNTFGIAGLALSAAFNGYLTQRADDGGLETTGDKVAMSNGLLIPVRLSVRDSEPAVLSCRVVGRSSDGTTAPMAVTADQTVPAAVVVPSVHTVGKVSINGGAYSLIQSMDLDFNIEVVALGGDGQVYPTKVFILSAAPRFTLESLDADLLATIGLAGTKQGATDSVISLRKFDANGGRVADVTAEHITFTIDDGLIYTETVEAVDGGADSVRIVIEPVWDATAGIIVVSAAAAIT